MEIRYQKNIGQQFNEQDQLTLLSKTIGVIGCGGNGGYLIDFLARLGVKKIILFDGDTFEESNLNRQLFCNENTIGQYKAIIAKDNILKINSKIIVDCYPIYFSNEYEIIAECDLIFAELDYTFFKNEVRQTFRRFLLDGKAIVDGSVTPFGCHSIIFTKDNIDTFDNITGCIIQYPPTAIPVSQPGWQCALAASIDLSLGIKYLCNKYLNICEEYSIDITHYQIIRNFLG